jgi:hypothetical protein
VSLVDAALCHGTQALRRVSLPVAAAPPPPPPPQGAPLGVIAIHLYADDRQSYDDAAAGLDPEASVEALPARLELAALVAGAWTLGNERGADGLLSDAKWFSGRLDNVRLWTRTLEAPERAARRKRRTLEPAAVTPFPPGAAVSLLASPGPR